MLFQTYLLGLLFLFFLFLTDVLTIEKKTKKYLRFKRHCEEKLRISSKGVWDRLLLFGGLWGVGRVRQAGWAQL